METVMVQFRHPGSAPTVAEVRRLFRLKPNEIDTEFGVIATDPDNGLYTVLVSARATKRVEAVLSERHGDPSEGIFSNPRVEPFGTTVDPFGPPQE